LSKAATVVAALPTLTRMRISSPAEWLRRHPRVRAALGFEDTIWTRKVTDDEIGRISARLDPPRVSVLELGRAMGDVRVPVLPAARLSRIRHLHGRAAGAIQSDCVSYVLTLPDNG
jgi:hypothetical protein